MKTTTEKKFDCVKSVRKERDRIAADTKGKSSKDILEYPVCQRRDTEHPFLAAGFGYLHTFDWPGLVAPRADLLYQRLAIGLQVSFELGYANPVHPACSFVGANLPVGFVQISLLDYLFYHRFVQVASFSGSYQGSRNANLDKR